MVVSLTRKNVISNCYWAVVKYSEPLKNLKTGKHANLFKNLDADYFFGLTNSKTPCIVSHQKPTSRRFFSIRSGKLARDN